MAETNLAALAEPFSAKEIKWKPQSVKGNRALAIAYIDARLVMDRLDAVLGVENWQDSYEAMGPGILCRLRIKVGGEWVTKEDVGSPSEQPDEGDKMKACVSDALKRAAIKFGIGRYLYRLPNVWVDYDPATKKIVNPPPLPEWAKPKQPEKPKPKTMAEVKARLLQVEEGLVKRKLASKGLLVTYVVAELAKAGHKGDLDKLPETAIEPAMKAANEFYADATKQKAPVTPPEEQYPPAIRSVMKLGGEAFGADSPEFAEWLQAQGIPTVQVLEMLNPEALTKLADKLGAMVAKKQAGANDQDGGDDIPY